MNDVTNNVRGLFNDMWKSVNPYEEYERIINSGTKPSAVMALIRSRQIELGCGVLRSDRYTVRKGWLVKGKSSFINGATVRTYDILSNRMRRYYGR